MNYRTAILKVIEHEGGAKITNIAADNGGLTKYGISQRAYPKVDIRNLTLEDAVAIYKRDYWDRVKGDEIPYSMAVVLFDQAVNRGVSTVVKQAQKILGITQDGVAGSQFVASIKKLSEASFVSTFLSESEKSYRAIASNNPSQSVFLNGWLNRVGSLKEYALANVGATAAVSSGVILVAVFFLILLTSSKKTKLS